MDDQPLPARGTYSLNFDDLDENVNPFAPSKSLASSPPAQRRTPTTNTPDRDTDNANSDGSNNKLSDDGSPQSGADLDINENTPTKKPPQSRLKKPSPRKTDTSKVRSKIVRPVVRKSPEKSDADDIEIFAPPPPRHIQSDGSGDSQSQADDVKEVTPPPLSNQSGLELGNKSSTNTNDALFAHVGDAQDLSPINDVIPNDVGVTSVQDSFGIPDDEFKPATDVFNDTASWDMLENFGRGQKKGDTTNLARESLYVRFDPLMKKNSPAVPAQSTMMTESIPEQGETPGRPVNGLDAGEDLLMMHTPPTSKLKHPAARQLQSKLEQPSPRSDVDKIFACDIQVAVREDKPVPSSRPPPAVTSSLPTDTDIVQVLKYSETDVAKLRMEHQATLLAKERDWEQKENQLLAKIKEHEESMDKMKQANEDMQKIVAEYERTVSQVIVDKAKLTTSTEENLSDAIRERNQAVDQLRTMESAFSDLYGRYEKAKGAVETLKTNEEELKKCIAEYQNKIKKHEQRYQLLKQHAEEKLQSANEEIDKIHKLKNAEVARVQAALKRAELQVSSLENSLQQKIQENKELTSICDDLIKQVGGDG